MRFSSASRLASGRASLALYLAALPLWLFSAHGWPHATPIALGTLGLYQWWRYHHRYRLVADTPTSRSATPVQGYGEFFGQARAPDGPPLITPYGHMRCVWYHASRQCRDDRQSVLADNTRHSSDNALLLQLGNGQLVIEPAGAQVETLHQRQWQDEQYQYRESWIAEGDPLYALGSVTTHAGPPGQQAWRDDLQLLLNEWKADRSSLLQRFDLNGNGQLDPDEWEAVRQAAHQAIDQQHRTLASIPPSHHLHRPADSRPFMLSWRTPQAQAQQLRLLSWCHAAAALAAGVWLARLG